MNSNMAFLSGHNIDFSGSKENVIAVIGSRLQHFKFENIQFFIRAEGV
jgi:hypothetical protein